MDDREFDALAYAVGQIRTGMNTAAMVATDMQRRFPDELAFVRSALQHDYARSWPISQLDLLTAIDAVTKQGPAS